MQFPDFLTNDPDGSIRVTGHRIGLEHVLFHCNRGWTIDQIGEFFPSLSPGLIAQVIDFYKNNQDEVNCYLKNVELELERQKRDAGPGVTHQVLQERMKARLQEMA